MSLSAPRLLAAVLLSSLATVRAQDGLYADFVTSLGSFTCQLHFDRAPQTVANFVSLATGERAWLDLRTGGASRRPFFNGITFHRVVGNFVIQGGSPNGNGTDGPGYTFRDEFHPTLRHSRAGILSMANSGPHSNGSQFFVTLAATSHLDDLHSVFGEVTSGMEVVTVIGNVAVDGSSKPLTPVVMNSVTIRRVGAAANAFNSTAQGLPSVGGAGPELLRNGANFALRFPRMLYSEYLLYHSDDLVNWTSERLGLYVSTPPTTDLDVTASAAGKARHFWRVPQIAYPGPLFTPLSLLGKRLRLTLAPSGDVVEYTINNSGGGTWVLTQGANSNTGSFSSHSWTQEAYRGRFFCAPPTLTAVTANLVFANETSGTFKGSTQNGAPITGPFTLDTPGAAVNRNTIQRISKRLAKPRPTSSASTRLLEAP